MDKKKRAACEEGIASQTYYPAFKANDARFDGRVFVGVSSTGIYCRPVCWARMPKEENCTFYHSAAAAESAGYRPCLLCRPELAPGSAPVDVSANTARRAARLMEEDGLCEGSLEELAESLGVTSRHLRRIFIAEYGVSPVQYLQTQRLLLTKSLLTDTDLSVTDVAFTAGFGSVRRFNDLFVRHYRMPPTVLRKQLKDGGSEDQDSVTLFLGYRPPYLWEGILSFLADRAIPGVEVINNQTYYRTAVIEAAGRTCRGWLAVRHAEKKKALAVTVSRELTPVLPKVLARTKQLFDLHCSPAEIYEKLVVMNELKAGMCVEGTRLPGCFDPFEMAVRAVLGQQVTVKAARTLAARLTTSYGMKLATPVHGLTHTFPTPADICLLNGPVENQLGPLGITGARARSILALAKSLQSGGIVLSGSADPQLQMERLLALPGFGSWTVQYVAMRALGWPDGFPHTDYGVKKALPGLGPKEILTLAEQWRPWRSYATINLWNSL